MPLCSTLYFITAITISKFDFVFISANLSFLFPLPIKDLSSKTMHVNRISKHPVVSASICNLWSPWGITLVRISHNINIISWNILEYLRNSLRISLCDFSVSIFLMFYVLQFYFNNTRKKLTCHCWKVLLSFVSCLWKGYFTICLLPLFFVFDFLCRFWILLSFQKQNMMSPYFVLTFSPLLKQTLLCCKLSSSSAVAIHLYKCIKDVLLIFYF